MPKTKTHSSAKKAFKITGTGKLLRRRGPQGHKFEHKSPKLKRAFSKDVPVADANAKTAQRLLGRR
jgi:large subunit ribosomal protein L35